MSKVPERVRLACHCGAALELSGPTQTAIAQEMAAKGWTLDPTRFVGGASLAAKCPKHAKPSTRDRLEA